jgi:hypothetical protein
MEKRIGEAGAEELLKEAVSMKNPVRGGVLTGSVGGGNEGKEVTSFRLATYSKANPMPILKVWSKKPHLPGRINNNT